MSPIRKHISGRNARLPAPTRQGLFASQDMEVYQMCLPDPSGAEINTILTLQQEQNELNICLTHVEKNGAKSVINNVEGVATQVYHLLLKQNYRYPNKLNWYAYVPATREKSEKFYKAPMVYKNNCFNGDDLQPLSPAPAILKHSVFSITADEIRESNAFRNNSGAQNTKTYTPNS